MRRTWGTGNSRRAGKSQSRGFSLLELMVVLAIAALMATAIPLTLNRLVPKVRLTKATQEVALAVREAQAHSLALSRPVHLNIGDHILLSDSNMRSGSTSQKSAVRIPGQIQFGGTDMSGQVLKKLTVYPDGTSIGARLELIDGRRRASVNVSALTGRVVVLTETLP